MAQPTNDKTSPPITPVDPARAARALEISARRKVYAKPSRDGKFRPMAEQGTAIGAVDYDTAVEALEAADAMIAVGEARAEETQATRMLRAMDVGMYVPWPRAAATGLAWDVLRVADGATMPGGPYAGLRAALLVIVGLVGVDVTPGPNVAPSGAQPAPGAPRLLSEPAAIAVSDMAAAVAVAELAPAITPAQTGRKKT